VRDNEAEHRSPEDAAPRAPNDAEQPHSKLTGYLAIGFGITATVVWTVVGTLNSTDKPGAGVDLHISVLVGLIGTVVGACAGALIAALRR
jgi:hypothetical protein